MLAPFLFLIARLALLVMTGLPAFAAVDRIIAVVEDEVILESELDKKLEVIRAGLAQSNTPTPPHDALVRQVLERLILDKIQSRMAERAGVRVDDETLRQAVQGIAARNRMSPEELRASLRQEGMDYNEFVEQIRNEIAVQRLRGGQINSQIKISDREVENWLEAHGKGKDEATSSEYLVGHILVSTPQAASPEEVQKAREKADALFAELQRGKDFKEASVASSDSDKALTGGDLGWRKAGQLPTLFAELVPKMKEGELQGPIRSPSGFHIVKLLGVRGGGTEHITKTHVRHILIKPTEVLPDEEARRKLESLRERIQGGDDFATLARGHSDDKGSAMKGGDLGFVMPGALVPEFETAMGALAINQTSEPVQTQFGWHLIQVLERQESEDSDELLKNRAREEIMRRRVEEETELWLRRIREEAYVEIRLNEPVPAAPMPAEKKEP